MGKFRLNLVCPLVTFAALFGATGASEAATVWSLADDFSLASNPNGAWTYQLENTADDLDTAYTPMDTNTQDANTIWGTTFAAPPTMWTETAVTGGGFWSIGRNDTGVTQTSAAVYWDPGEVLLHPRVPIPGRFVATWTAPSAMTVDANWAYAKRMTIGTNGVGMGVLHESGGTNTVLRAFADPGGAAGMFDDLAVSAGDKLHFRFDNWGDAGGDITWAEIRVNEVAAGPGTVVFSEDFNSYTGNQNNVQFATGLEVAYGGTVTGWSNSGAGAVHAVDLNNLGGQNNSSDWAIMFFQDNVIEQTAGIANSNESGQEYELTLDYGTGVYAASSQQTGPFDGLLVEILRGDNSVLASGEFFPGAWANNFNLGAGLEGTVAYIGDGTGDIHIRIGPVRPFNTGRFEGEIDNLVLRSFASPVPEPGTFVLLATGLLGLLACAWRKRR